METAIWTLVFVGVCNLIATWVGVNDRHKHLSNAQMKLSEIQNLLINFNNK